MLFRRKEFYRYNHIIKNVVVATWEILGSQNRGCYIFLGKTRWPQSTLNDIDTEKEKV